MPKVFTTQRPPVRGTNHMISSGHYLASAAGYKILENGGNAIDAGVAAGIVLGITLPHWVSFGGVAPIMIYSSESKEISTISGVGKWPELASIEYFKSNSKNGIPSTIEKAVTPAACDSWLTAIENFGTMSFEEVVEPALEICNKGFVIQGTLAHFLPDMEITPELSTLLMKNGELLKEGEILKQKQLGKTFSRLIDIERQYKNEGRVKAIRKTRDYFYKGEIAKEIDEFFKKNGGLLSKFDLENFSVEIEKPEIGTYKEYTIATCGAWCQGPIFIEVLNLLENTDLKNMEHNSANYIHTIVEAIKLSFSDRHFYIGDPKFVNVPLKGMLSKEYAKERSKLINKHSAFTEMPHPGNPFKYQEEQNPDFILSETPRPSKNPHEGDTSYVAVVDKWGNAFSATPSDGYSQGGICPELGLHISERGSQGSLAKNNPNFIMPMKRPRITPNPSIILKNGSPYMALGSPGNDRQPQAMLQVLLNMEIFGFEPQKAIELPRLASFSFPSATHPNKSYPNMLMIEEDFPDQIAILLREYGHNVKKWPRMFWQAGGVCLVRYNHCNNTFESGADPRRDSYAQGI